MDALDLEHVGDGLHRLAKMALDSGEAASIDEALRLFEGYALHVVASDVGDPARQAALLTAVNAGARAFLGGVTVEGDLDRPCMLPGWSGRVLLAVVIALGGVPCDEKPPKAVAVAIGGGRGIRAIIRGWCAGVASAGDTELDDIDGSFVLAGVAAGAMAVAEAFQVVRKRNAAAGRRRFGLSLWRTELVWTDPDALGRQPDRLPASAWLIGLGNLGQAFLWSIGMLPYRDPARVTLTLQDFDRIAPSNLSTSLLTDRSVQGQPKTRAMAEWAETRGFQTRIVERRFAADFRVGDDDPAIALCGVDNALARAQLEKVGFERVIEAGLGGGPDDFLALRLHTFPGPRNASELWRAAAPSVTGLLDQPAYRALKARGADRCGLISLAGRTVGAPFVGALAGALVIGELVKVAGGGPSTAVLDLHLRSPQFLSASAQGKDFGCSIDALGTLR